MAANDKDMPGAGNPEEKLILIVDDDESVWDLLYYIVRREGFRTEQAGDGKEALEKARLLRPSLILLDMMLPKVDGYEIVRELQKEGTSDIPIVLLSSRDLDHSELEMLKGEPNLKDFMEKPIEPGILAARLHTLLNTRPRVRGVAE